MRRGSCISSAKASEARGFDEARLRLTEHERRDGICDAPRASRLIIPVTRNDLAPIILRGHSLGETPPVS